MGYYLSTIGLQYTTPSKNAFLGATYSTIVPFLIWVFYKVSPQAHHFISSIFCLIGVGFISLEQEFYISFGDYITLLGSLFYALHIILLQKYISHVDEFAFTTYQFFGGTILSFFVSILFEDITIIQNIHTSILFQIFYLGIVCTCIAMLCQAYQ